MNLAAARTLSEALDGINNAETGSYILPAQIQAISAIIVCSVVESGMDYYMGEDHSLNISYGNIVYSASYEDALAFLSDARFYAVYGIVKNTSYATNLQTLAVHTQQPQPYYSADYSRTGAEYYTHPYEQPYIAPYEQETIAPSENMNIGDEESVPEKVISEEPDTSNETTLPDETDSQNETISEENSAVILEGKEKESVDSMLDHLITDDVKPEPSLDDMFFHTQNDEEITEDAPTNVLTSDMNPYIEKENTLEKSGKKDGVKDLSANECLMLQANDITYQMLGVIIYDANDDVCCRANLYAAPVSNDEMIVKFETDLGNKGIRTVKGKNPLTISTDVCDINVKRSGNVPFGVFVKVPNPMRADIKRLDGGAKGHLIVVDEGIEVHVFPTSAVKDTKEKKEDALTICLIRQNGKDDILYGPLVKDRTFEFNGMKLKPMAKWEYTSGSPVLRAGVIPA